MVDVDFARIPLPARVLGFAGLVPFVAGAVGVWTLDPPNATVALVLQLQYAAIILSFLGAVHWGAAIAQPGGGGASWGRLGWSVIPALAAWIGVQLPPVSALLVLILALFGAWAADLWAARNGLLPLWYIKLRKPLSLIAILALAMSFFGLGGVLGASA